MRSRKALFSACLIGALAAGACTGPTRVSAPADQEQSGSTAGGDRPGGIPAPPRALPAQSGAGAPTAPGQGQKSPQPGTGATGGAANGTPGATGPAADKTPTPGLAGEPLAPGCGGTSADQGPIVPPAMVVTPGWGRAGSQPFPARTARRAGCRYAVGGSSLSVDIRLPPEAQEEATRLALQVKGAEPTYVHFSPEGPRMAVGFTGGPNGQELQVGIKGPVTAGSDSLDLQVTLVRDFPALTVSVRQPSGDWQLQHHSDTLPVAPTELRFSWDRPVSQLEAEERVQRARGLNRLSTAVLNWPDAQTLVVQLPTPPPLVVVDMGGVPGPGGVATYAAPTVLRTGSPPVLEAVDVFSGTATKLGPVPPEPNHALVAASGRYVAFSTFAPQADGAWWAPKGWVLDLKDRSLQPAPFYAFLGWTGDGALVGTNDQGVPERWVPATGERRQFTVSDGARYTSLSPYGHQIAGVLVHWDQEDHNTFLAPADLVVLDLQTGAEKRYPDWSHYYVTHSEFGIAFPVIWIDGGRAIASRDYRGRTAYQWVVMDLNRGARHPLTPDEAAELPPPVTVLNGPPGWRLEQEQEWQTVFLVGATGNRRDLGNGLPVGWLPDGRALIIRWESSQLRYQPNLSD